MRVREGGVIHLLFTGGTISMRRDAAAGGNVPALDGEALVGFAPELARVTPFRIEDWGRFPASHMGPDKLWELRERVRAVAEGATGGERPTGIVVTHGTDTIEETAYLLARTLDPAVPVVVTGAMRTSSEEGWDGPGNLTDSARVAAHPHSRGRGVLVVIAGKVFAGHEASKVHATAVDSFDAPHSAPVGVVSHGAVRFLRQPVTRLTPLSPPGLSARVAMVPVVIGDQGEALDLLRPSHDGVILVAYGAGNSPPGVMPAVERWLAEGKPVVLASRCLRGEVTPVYAFPGGGATLVALGAIPAGPRTPAQARMELLIALSAGQPYGAGTGKH